MYLLAIETTGAFASVALLEDDCVLEHIQGHDRFSHLQNLMPQVKEVLENHKLSINDVSAIAVSKGPGSFTGIRIGVSSTRALCQVLGVPGVPVSSLEALAMRVADLPGEKRRSTGDTLDDRIWICPILDARRSQVYGGGYVLQNGSITTAEAMDILCVKDRRARAILLNMVEHNFLTKRGAARSTIYVRNA